MTTALKIKLEHCEKKFGQQVLFKNLNYVFEQPQSYALLGPNGTGKSTLLGMLYGYTSASAGAIHWEVDGKKIDREEVYNFCSFASPYMELPEELTASEIWDFHFSLKSQIAPVSKAEGLEMCKLDTSAHKQLKNFSSGMKSRLKLALAVFSDSKALMLDEPCTNMDKEGIATYHELLDKYLNNRLLIIASNLPDEYERCAMRLDLKAGYHTTQKVNIIR